MADLNVALAGNLRAVHEFLARTDRLGDVWTTPRAPGKWSPAELTEHLARTFQGTTGIIKGTDVGLPRVPRPLRPLLRRFVLRRILESGRFGRPVKTFKPFEPLQPAPSPAEGRARLLAAAADFEAQVRALAPIGDYTFDHPTFGKLKLSDYVRFQEIHTRHHMRQLPEAARAPGA